MKTSTATSARNARRLAKKRLTRMNKTVVFNFANEPLTQQAIEAMHERTPLATNGKHFTKALLIQCAENWETWNFNRQLSDKVKELPNLNFPVLYAMVHKHAWFKRREAHIRVEVLLSPASGWAGERRSCIVDVPLEFFNSLPS